MGKQIPGDVFFFVKWTDSLSGTGLQKYQSRLTGVDGELLHDLGTVHKVQRRQQKEIHDQLTADPPSPSKRKLIVR